MTHEDKTTDTAVQANDVRTPQRLRAFYELLDKQAAEEGNAAPNDGEKHFIVTMIRAHGLLWAGVQAAHILEDMERRIAALEDKLNTWETTR